MKKVTRVRELKHLQRGMGAEKRVQVFKVGTDELVMEFNSVKECAAYFNLDSSYISYNLSGKYKTIKKKQYYCRAVEKIYYNPNANTANTGRNPRAVDVFEDGELVGTYDSVTLASNATGVTPASIGQYCRGERKKPIKGYTFRYNQQRQLEIKRVPVDLYDVETNELYKSFSDIQECADFLGLTPQTIRANLRGDTKTVKVNSFYCKYGKKNG